VEGWGVSQAKTLWVYVVDDDPDVLKAFRRLLQTEGYNVGTFESPRAFLNANDPAAPGCVLLDVGMMEMDGLETQKQLAAVGDTRPVIFVTGLDDVPASIKAMKAGAHDYLIKPVANQVLLTAVATAVQHDLLARRERVNLAKQAHQWQSLSGRQREVMNHVVRGRLNKQIAFDLGITEKTAKVHRARVMEKMAVRSVAELVRVIGQLERAGHLSKAVDSHAQSDPPIDAATRTGTNG
jgi:FixJ family two-component response regulator